MANIPTEELREIHRTLTADVIDDPEDLMEWFLEHGATLIHEVLQAREVIQRYVMK